jgi:integrase
MSCGNRPGTHKRRKPARTVGDRYTVNAYLQAIYKACDKAFPPPPPLAKAKGETAAQWRARLTPDQRTELKAWRQQHRWHPHQLRHNFGTKMRRLHGLEVARILLGHTSPAITAMYAEADREKAVRAVRDVG